MTGGIMWRGKQKFKHLERVAGGSLVGFGIEQRGEPYYVLGGEAAVLGNDADTGTSWEHAFATITRALAVASAWDTIVVGCNTSATYLEGATLAINNMGTKLFGAMTSGYTWGVPSVHTHGTETLVKINAHACEIAYLGFHSQGAGCSLEICTTESYWRNHIHDCYFGGNNTALWAIVMGNYTGSGVGTGSTIDAPCTVVERCHISFYAEGDIYMACGYGSRVDDCDIEVGTALIGIQYPNNTTSRPFAYILNNRFHTIDSTDAVGISVTNTPSAGYFFVNGNQFVNFADNNHCISKRTGYTGLNYLGLTAIAIT